MLHWELSFQPIYFGRHIQIIERCLLLCTRKKRMITSLKTLINGEGTDLICIINLTLVYWDFPGYFSITSLPYNPFSFQQTWYLNLNSKPLLWDLFTYPCISPMYTWSIYMLINSWFSLVNLFFCYRGLSQLRTMKGRCFLLYSYISQAPLLLAAAVWLCWLSSGQWNVDASDVFIPCPNP